MNNKRLKNYQKLLLNNFNNDYNKLINKIEKNDISVLDYELLCYLNNDLRMLLEDINLILDENKINQTKIKVEERKNMRTCINKFLPWILSYHLLNFKD